MPTPKLDIDLLMEGVDGVVLVNEAILKLENCLSSVVLNITNTPPGAPDQGDTYIVGTAPTGVWVGHANELALATGNGWVHVPPRSNMVAYIDDDKERWAYDENESSWYPLQPLWKTTEHWTGRYKDGSKVWSKSINFGALPNATTKSVAHGVTGMNMAYMKAPTAEGSVSNGTVAAPLHFISTAFVILDLTIDATNINLVTGSNLSGSSAFIRLEYCKT